jgi:hypothetical protein
VAAANAPLSASAPLGERARGSQQQGHRALDKSIELGISERSNKPGSLIEAKRQAIENNSVRLCIDQLFACNKPPNVHMHHP